MDIMIANLAPPPHSPRHGPFVRSPSLNYRIDSALLTLAIPQTRTLVAYTISPEALFVASFTVI